MSKLFPEVSDRLSGVFPELYRGARRLPEPATDAVNLYVTRHTETDIDKDDRSHGWLDIPLNAKGVSEAEDIAEQFSGLPVGEIHSSDLTRAQQTAHIVADSMGAQVKPTPDLRPINMGVLSGMKHDEIEGYIKPIVKAWQKDPTIQIPQGESFADYQNRVLKAVQGLISQKKPGDSVAIMGHSHTVSLLDAMARNGALFPLGGKDVDTAQHGEGSANIAVYAYAPDGGFSKRGDWKL